MASMSPVTDIMISITDSSIIIASIFASAITFAVPMVEFVMGKISGLILIFIT